ncbi:cyclopropane fatty acyl phospholipid synthase [Cellvibrio japonicus]|nr:cyclopropane fatty acyl phospholipid synthase [Cellvibrio japonicus]QEI12602.1 cyclopropane fatty acyl phospholipid synthase [Cellvibrio japonicus]QEI16176.1 cyclopropane fatty acyl phospholipid synthase [Cellvibrio japonicus]QEI19754.1 cyclopropane fatty acyl phospholipid synthase [Cellvibrio japonicus]
MNFQSSPASQTKLSRPRPQQPHQQLLQNLLNSADIRINGDRPWDMRLHHPDTAKRILLKGSLGLGESYMDGWWDCEQIDEMVSRGMRAGLHQQIRNPGLMLFVLKATLFNRQSQDRAWQVGKEHYDLGNDLFEKMLDPYMAYSCGYWEQASSLEAAQQAKLELICRKLQLTPGMKILDIGCGWGSFMRYAAEHYGVECIGLTISHEQAEYGKKLAGSLPIQFELTDYRQMTPGHYGRFDRIVSVGMFEHVGHKNYRQYFQVARHCLKDDGLFLLHTIGKKTRGPGVDPWIEKYIFPNGVLPSVAEIADACEDKFVIEDLHNFGSDYDKTLMAWHHRFEAAWPELQHHYSPRFYRMWRFYLLLCAGSFRARDNQLWQWVLAPKGVDGGYRRPHQ